MINVVVFIVISLVLLAQSICGQEVQGSVRSQLDPTVWGVVYDIPGTKNVKVTKDVPYSGSLAIDIFRPSDLKAGEKRPAVIFLNGIGDSPGNRVKNWEIYQSWPRLIAAHGMIGISMDADSARIQAGFRDLFAFIERNGVRHGIDAAKLGVYAASANVTESSIYLMSADAAKGIKAAALYYGAAPQSEIRKDLPVLFILAESDLQGLGQSALPLWQKVAEKRAPWSLVFASGLPHAFDAFEDTDESRRLVRQTVDFWKSHLEPVPHPTWKPSKERAIVASTYWNDPQRTVALLGDFLKSNPSDAQALTMYGRALQQTGDAEGAASAYERAFAVEPSNPRVTAGLGLVRVGQKRYEEGERLLSNAIEGGFRNSLFYGQLAFAQLAQNKNQAALQNYAKAFEAGIPPGANTRGLAYYNMACAYARLKQADKAFEMLAKAIDAGFSSRTTIEADEDLAVLRTDARFAQLLQRLSKSQSN